nr:hypothetical protein [uncultured Cetobacterium sp.]
MKKSASLIILLIGFFAFNVYAKGNRNTSMDEHGALNGTLSKFEQIMNHSSENIRVMTGPEAEQTYVSEANTKFVMNKMLKQK